MARDYYPLPPGHDPEIAALLLPVPRTGPTFAKRVFNYVDFGGDCWEWTRGKTQGYGVIGRGLPYKGNVRAHLAMYQLLVGEIPEGLQWDHLCRNHACVNPDHGEFVTLEENLRRGYSPPILLGKRKVCGNGGHPLDGIRSSGGKTYRYCKTCLGVSRSYPVTHCINGHEYTPENTRTDPKSGKRHCRTCQRASRETAKKAAA